MTGVSVEEVAQRCTEVESGARNVDNILTNTLLPDLSCQLLAAFAEERGLRAIHLGVGQGGAFIYGTLQEVAAGTSI